MDEDELEEGGLSRHCVEHGRGHRTREMDRWRREGEGRDGQKRELAVGRETSNLEGQRSVQGRGREIAD